MSIPATHLALAQTIADRYSTHEAVEAVAIGGSMTTGLATDASDIDVYVFVTRDLTTTERESLIAPYARSWQAVDYWGAGDVFFDRDTGIEVDMVYFNTAWMSEQVTRTLDRHEAWMGYTTAFWHTCKHSVILFDRQQWFHRLHAKAQSPYPRPLAEAIVTLNYPVLAQIVPSYRRQIASAVQRGDLVSVNHRLSAFFASYFDIIFAVNHVLHPGEKRQLEHAQRLCHTLPDAMVSEVQTILTQAGQPSDALLTTLDALMNHLTAWLTQQGYLA